jgi:hypothetical protein
MHAQTVFAPMALSAIPGQLSLGEGNVAFEAGCTLQAAYFEKVVRSCGVSSKQNSGRCFPAQCSSKVFERVIRDILSDLLQAVEKPG